MSRHDLIVTSKMHLNMIKRSDIIVYRVFKTAGEYNKRIDQYKERSTRPHSRLVVNTSTHNKTYINDICSDRQFENPIEFDVFIVENVHQVALLVVFGDNGHVIVIHACAHEAPEIVMTEVANLNGKWYDNSLAAES